MSPCVLALLLAAACGETKSSDLSSSSVAGSGSDSSSGLDSNSDPTSEDAASEFTRVVTEGELFECPKDVPDVAERLCPAAADPDGAPDKVFVECAFETGCFAPQDLAPKGELVVMAYNIERGRKADAQLAALIAGTKLPTPDVLLLSEVDRGCERTGYRNVMREYAEALGMNYVYGVEFVELRMRAPCEHGNGILSRYPMANPEIIRHASNKSWFEDGGEPRLGGRVAVRADVVVGDKFINVTSVHFESNISEQWRSAQAVEMAELGLLSNSRVLIGGDINSGLYRADLLVGGELDQTARAFLERGYWDAHAEVGVDERPTRGGMILDVLFTNAPFTSSPGLLEKADWEALSDHSPVWATVHLD